MVALAAFASLWALLETVVAGQLSRQYDLMQVVWSRYATHLTTLVLIFGWRRPGRLWRTSRLGFQLSRSLLMLVMPASFAWALRFGAPADDVWSVFWISPLLIVALAHVVLGERATWQTWVAAALGAVAAAFAYAPPPPPSLLLLTLPVLMAVSFSVYVVMTRSLRHEAVHANLFYTALGVFLSLTPLMPRVWVTPSLHDAVVLAGIGVVGLLALYTLDRAASLAPVSGTVPVLHLYIVGVLVIGQLTRHEVPSLQADLGCAIILAVVGAVWLHQRHSLPDGWRGAGSGGLGA